MQSDNNEKDVADGGDDTSPDRPRRDVMRKEAADYAALAEELTRGKLVNLPDPPFDEDLRDAVAQARTMLKSAQSRQIRRVAQLLKACGTPAELQQALKGRTAETREQQTQERVNEAWRTRLLEEGDASLTAFLTEYPSADRTRLRQLGRQARKDPTAPRSKRASTTLLREIRAVRAREVSDVDASPSE